MDVLLVVHNITGSTEYPACPFLALLLRGGSSGLIWIQQQRHVILLL